MFCYKFVSILVFVCLIISLIACLMGTLTKQWWIGDFEAIVPLQNVTRIPHGYKMHLLFDVRFGLTGVCYRVKHALVHNDSLSEPLLKEMKKCPSTDLPDNLVLRNIMKENQKPFKNTFICLILCLIFNVLALIFALIKLPCLTISGKRMVLFTTLILALIAAIVGIAALIISDQKIHYNAPFMKFFLSSTPHLGEDVTPMAVQILRRVFAKVKTTNLSDNFERGASFDLVCVGVAFLLLAVILSLVEHCCARRSGDDEYKSRLIAEGYSLPEKRHDKSVSM